jgi:hypothetical protein
MRTKIRTAFVAVAVVSVWLAVRADNAWAFCRTLTCPTPPSYPDPASEECVPPDGEYEAFCASLTPPVTVIVPLWWSNACISYDLQEDAGPRVTLDQATSIVDTAFATWRTASCSTGTPSIIPMDLGPVSCGAVQYNGDQGNQHVIVFRDPWPYDDQYNTLGLTTVHFDVETGEIYDADTEINGSVALSISAVPLSGGYDLQSIMTHEAGHFLGMAHATDASSTMYYSYIPGSTNMRSLTADDTSGVCTIYPPDGTRTVDPSVDGGFIPAGPCDPSPRHGFSTVCGGPITSGCAMSPSAPRSDGAPTWALGLFSAGLVRTRTRRRRP